MLSTLLITSLMITPSGAQTAGEQAKRGDCVAADTTQPATPLEKGDHSGTKNMGSTGWSGGGLGGAYNDTTTAGPRDGSKSSHPETARGVDPTTPAGKTLPPC